MNSEPSPARESNGGLCTGSGSPSEGRGKGLSRDEYDRQLLFVSMAGLPLVFRAITWGLKEQQSDSGQQRQPPEGPGSLRALTSAASNGMELFWNQRQPGELGITTDTVIQRSLRWVDLFIFRIWDDR